jgi:multidrug efflux pump subunit AcrB
MALMTAALVAAVLGFGQVKNAFFPASSLPLFMVDYWLPQGSDIRAVEADIEQLEQELLALPGVRHVTATIGRGAERFMLTYAPELSYPSYAQLIVEADDFDAVGPTIEAVDARLWEGYPQAFTRIQRFEIGPSTKAKLEARLIGPDPDMLRDLGDAVIAIFEAEPDAINVRQDWRERTKIYQPVLNEAEARRLGITRQDLDRALAMNTDGVRVGLYRWGSRLLPIILRPPEAERDRVERLEDILVYSPVKQALVVWITVPLSLIGVTVGLLTTGAPFSFMALLALLSLIGMQLKNGIVLVEEIKRLREEEGEDWLPAIVEAAVSRVRPVTMAALTTILGMLPLLADVFFQPMAVTIMFGLGFATVLTLFVVPVLFALFYGVRYRPGKGLPADATQALGAG